MKTDTQTFPHLMAVKDFLKKKGYEISKSQLYRDKAAGLLRVEADGKSVSLAAVWEYTERYREKTGVNKDDLSDLQALKAKKSLELREEQIKRMRFAREKEEGRYVPKEEVDLKIISTLTVLDVSFRQLMDMHMSDICRLLGGDIKKLNPARDFMDTALDDMMNRLSNTDSFSIKIEEA